MPCRPDEAASILLEASPELDEELVKASQEYLKDQYKADVKQWGYIDPARWNAFYGWLNENGLSEAELPKAGFSNDYRRNKGSFRRRRYGGIKVSNVSKSFDGVKILEDISIELHDQELVSLLGVSGGGKTTLFNVISGLEKPETGHVYLDGREITGCPGNVSYMLQKDMLLPYRTIEDNVALPLLIKGEKKKAAREKVQP